MKITAISDLHGFLPKDLPGGDVLCICGDIVPLDYQRSFTQSVAWFALDFNAWACGLPYGKVVFIGGNHDFFLGSLTAKFRPSDVLKQLLPGTHRSRSSLVYLCDNSVEIGGVRFYGTPWIADLSRWAFYRDDEGLREAYGAIPKRCDVLLTHMPPRACGAGTVLQEGCRNTLADYGSEALAQAVSVRDIGWHLCGHVHSGSHSPQPFGGVRNLVNVSVKDEDYRVAYAPFSFEI